MPEPTSTLTFEDLIKEVARKIGVASYGSDGLGELQVPTDAHDLAECKRHVNNAIRMFYSDAPGPNGWRFSRPTTQLVMWTDIAVDSTNVAVSGGYVPATNKTLLTTTSDSFYPTMEEHNVALTGIGTFRITDYVSATQIKVAGDASGAGAAGVTWTILGNGNFTMPKAFSGEYTGQPTYIADTNQGVSLEWADETLIRQWRENITDESGDPYWCAVRIQETSADAPRRRWEFMAYPAPDEVLTIELPLHLHFDKLVDLDEVIYGVPFAHDETIKAACLAVCEKDVEDNVGGPAWTYYKDNQLRNSFRIDAQSAPKKLGYFGNPSGATFGASAIQIFRGRVYQRPTVPFNT